MASLTIVEELKLDVLAKLTEQPMTTTELSTVFNAAYPSVRRAVVELLDEGKIMPYDRRARNARYTLGTVTGASTRVPRVKWNADTLKLTEFTDIHSIPVGMQTLATEVLKSWVLIAKSAEQLNEGYQEAPIIHRINRQRGSLLRARSAVENFLFFINQLIDNPQLWDVVNIMSFPQDKDWPEFSGHLQDMYNELFPLPPETGRKTDHSE